MIDLEALKEELNHLKPRTKLFKLLKNELSVLGYWKNRARGNPRKGFECMLGKGKHTKGAI